MELVPTTRANIEKYMREQNLKLQHFSDITGINVGTLSAILKGSRPMSMNQLNQITYAMGLEKGYFYESYGVESFIESAPHWRRLEPYLYECAELGKLDCIQQVITYVTDDRSYIEELYGVAESLYGKGMNEAALILYRRVADSEKYQHSERLALCQYRIFLLHKTLSKFDNLKAAIKFEPYIDKLNEEVQLDAIKDLANIYASISLWDKVL
ncbi:helix-turn-helix transcriptional regulator [Paenibacillus sp. FSL R7-0652]|uniref:helix-turn-helix domain-containing protein n=1 Tax=Paenibacillus sp. FSL R7-0652 TaxID=2921687 RepID=UPI00315A8633